MNDDIIEIDDYEVKDKQIVESDEDDFENKYNQREYTESEYVDEGGFSGIYRSFSLDNKALLILSMVIILLVVIFIMTFD